MFTSGSREAGETLTAIVPWFSFFYVVDWERDGGQARKTRVTTITCWREGEGETERERQRARERTNIRPAEGTA